MAFGVKPSSSQGLGPRTKPLFLRVRILIGHHTFWVIEAVPSEADAQRHQFGETTQRHLALENPPISGPVVVELVTSHLVTSHSAGEPRSGRPAVPSEPDRAPFGRRLLRRRWVWGGWMPGGWELTESEDMVGATVGALRATLWDWARCRREMNRPYSGSLRGGPPKTTGLGRRDPLLKDGTRLILEPRNGSFWNLAHFGTQTKRKLSGTAA